MDHIVLGFDGTEPSWVALDWVAERAARGACRVELIHVRRADPLAEPSIEVRDAQRRITDRAPSAEVTSRNVSGGLPDALIDAARGADLLVIGAHRRPPVRSALSRWLPLRMVARSVVPTVVVPDDWAPNSGPVLVGLDDDDSSSSAAPFAAAEAEAAGVALALLHAWQMPVPTTDGPHAFVASSHDVKAAHRTLLDEAHDRISAAHPALSVEASLVKDNPSSALMVRSARASLVVLGTHHRGLFEGAILGSVCQDVLWQSKTPVCVVPVVASAA